MLEAFPRLCFLLFHWLETESQPLAWRSPVILSRLTSFKTKSGKFINTWHLIVTLEYVGQIDGTNRERWTELTNKKGHNSQLMLKRYYWQRRPSSPVFFFFLGWWGQVRHTNCICVTTFSSTHKNCWCWDLSQISLLFQK